MNPVPFTVSVKPAPPVTAAPGDSVVRDAAGAELIVKFVAAEVSPLSVFTTVMGTVPAVAISDEGIASVSCVELTTVVAVCLTPFHATCAPLRKPAPFTVRVKLLPTLALFGEIVVIVGRGAAVTEKFVAEVFPPSGFVTVTGIVAAERPRSLVAMAAVTCDELTKIVVLLVPFHCTVAPETKPEPFTVRVKAALPAVALFGESVVTVGLGRAGTELFVLVATNTFPYEPEDTAAKS
jgi:hypothetical protein